ncbi:MAG TPA: BamA/TamA family outer membrane protein [Flavobacterium sp.]|nr:BamA/TamA family outer membrane protein [Flavobacterium sp.]
MAACNAVKRVPDGKHLLTKNEVSVNGKNISDETVTEQLYQKPNSSILGYRLRLNLFNLAKVNPDSSYKAKFLKHPGKYERMAKLLSKKQVDRLGKSFYYFGIHNFLKKSGEAPVIINEQSTKKSQNRLRAYYFNNGYFDVATDYKIDTIAIKKAKIKYTATTGSPYAVDTIKTTISTPALDSLYNANKENTLLKSGKQFRTADFDAEKNRITTNFRNRGVFHFQQNYVKFDIDTIKATHKANVNLLINDYSYRENDSTKTEPFKIYKISKVNIFSGDPDDKTFTKMTDTVVYNNFTLYSNGKLRYKPKAITDAVFVVKDGLFADYKTTLTSRYLSNLRVFNYPNIQYAVDSTGNGLIANIYLVSRPKYSFGYGLDFTHSNIQDFGISGTSSVSIRNIFRGAETLEISGRGNIGSSKYFANPGDNFFNVLEYGADVKLSLPRIFFPVNTEKIIPKSMIPSTVISFGIAKQQNIGLDKENFTGALTYNWTPKRFRSARFDLFNIQYVNNVNIGNYFKIYQSSYDALNDLAHEYGADPGYFYADTDGNPDNDNLIIDSGTNGFINDVTSQSLPTSESDLKTVRSIEERRQRLTENNLVFASSYTFSKTTKADLQDDTFHVFKVKVESAGNTLALLAKVSKELKSQGQNNTILGVAYSQYIKTELEFIKHFDLGTKKVLAMRAFGGIAIPYGNSNSVPFSRSYFAGGSNDNRAWQSYGLGPGSSQTINDFNEANMKLAFSTEYRFNIFGGFNGALFIDAGNIWNVLDNVTDDKATFDGFKSLSDTAIGSGFGIRYDFNFFVVRLDTGFKTYNPADESQKWFRDYNFSHSVLNIGINYPF